MRPSNRLALALVATAAGTFVIAIADSMARDSTSGARLLFWVGYLVLVLPPIIAVSSKGMSRTERCFGLIALASALYTVKVLHSPTGPTFHDEFSTWRATSDIFNEGHLFAPDPLIPVHPVYPGLPVAAGALADASGMSIFAAAIAIVGAARILLAVGLMLLLERALGSARLGAIATCVYLANPNAMFFGSQFAYESIALPCAVVFLAWAWQPQSEGKHVMIPATLLTVLLTIAVVTAHHLTSAFVLLALALGLAAAGRLRRRADPSDEPDRVALAVFVVVLIAWTALAASRVFGYLGPVLGDAASAIGDLALGRSSSKPLFQSPAVATPPAWERYASLLGVVILLAVAAAGALEARKTRSSLTVVATVIALMYPLTLVSRLTQAGTELSNRSSEFLFIGLGVLFALASTRLLSTRVARGLALPAMACVLISGVVVGWAGYARLPGRYLVGADPRSMDAPSVDTSLWVRGHIPRGQRWLADRSNQLLLGSYGGQRPVTGSVAGRSTTEVFTRPTTDAVVRQIIRDDSIDYVAVDRRLAAALPAVGVYFERDEPGADAHAEPLNAAALEKFDQASDASKVYDNGSIAIYDVRDLHRTPPSVGPQS